MHVVFLSYSESDRDRVLLIKGRAFNRQYQSMGFRTQDLLKRWKTDEPAVIRRAISTRLQGTSKTIVFVGKDTYHSRWVAEEVRMTLERGKPVYAIEVDEDGGPTPPILRDRGIRVHPWSEKKLQQLVSS